MQVSRLFEDAGIHLRRFIAPPEQALAVGTAVGDAIARFFAMALTMSSDGVLTTLKKVIPGLDKDGPGMEIVSAVSLHLRRELDGIEGDIFAKSIQETLYEAAGLGNDPDQLDIGAGLENYLQRHDPQEFLQLFLSLYVFNTIWIRIQDDVRIVSGRSFIDDMTELEDRCALAVRSVIELWRTDGRLAALPARNGLGDKLLKGIESCLLKP